MLAYGKPASLGPTNGQCGEPNGSQQWRDSERQCRRQADLWNLENWILWSGCHLYDWNAARHAAHRFVPTIWKNGRGMEDRVCVTSGKEACNGRLAHQGEDLPYNFVLCHPSFISNLSVDRQDFSHNFPLSRMIRIGNKKA